MINQTISLPFAYDFDSALVRLARDPINAVNVEEREVLVPMEEGNVIRLKGTGSTLHPAFEIENVVDDAQMDRLFSIFHFDRPLDEIARHFEKTDLAPIFEQYAGMPIIKSFSLYGTLVKSIIHQQLNLKFADVLLMRFVEVYGKNENGVWRYPKPEEAAMINVEDLRMLQFSNRKAEYIIEVSRAIAEGRLELNKFETMDDEEIISELVAIRGIGPWTAQSFLLFGLGRANLFPMADIGLQNALKLHWKMDRKPTYEEMAERFPIWSPYLSYASLYLWKSIE